MSAVNKRSHNWEPSPRKHGKDSIQKWPGSQTSVGSQVPWSTTCRERRTRAKASPSLLSERTKKATRRARAAVVTKRILLRSAQVSESFIRRALSQLDRGVGYGSG